MKRFSITSAIFCLAALPATAQVLPSQYDLSFLQRFGANKSIDQFETIARTEYLRLNVDGVPGLTPEDH